MKNNMLPFNRKQVFIIQQKELAKGSGQNAKLLKKAGGTRLQLLKKCNEISGIGLSGAGRCRAPVFHPY